MLTYLSALIALIRMRTTALRADERGYSTETVVVTALLVGLAIAVLGIIIAAVTAKVDSIDLGQIPPS